MSAAFSINFLRKEVTRAIAGNPSWRAGQAYWITALGLWPMIVRPLSGSQVDPFYDDANIEPFLAKILDDFESLGSLARKALERPTNYASLDATTQWEIDKRLGILDWSGALNE